MDEYKIRNINIKGFKSIDSEGVNIPLGDINVFVGANGVGKSNMISFFEMLEAINNFRLQNFIRYSGGANTVLHYGAITTKVIELEINIDKNISKDAVIRQKYICELANDVKESMFIKHEKIDLYVSKLDNVNFFEFNKGSLESDIFPMSKDFVSMMKKNNTNNLSADAFGLTDFINSFKVYKFADTSTNSRMRNSVYINDGRKLHSDGGNLAAFLYTLKNQAENVKYYQRIVKYIKMVMPQFNDFELLPDAVKSESITLSWNDNESEYLFGPHQISDGSLRFMALATLLLQPPTTLPSLIVIDEPELGLHPAAISILASMIHTASQHCQLVLATQSTTLIDEFEAKHIIVVEREGNHSTFKRLNTDDMQDWLQRYSLSEIWEKNIIGGRP